MRTNQTCAITTLAVFFSAAALDAQELTGTVLSPDGKPVVGTRIEIVADTRLQRWLPHKIRVETAVSSKTAADGTFAFDTSAMVPQVAYSLFVVTDEFADLRIMDLVRPHKSRDLGKIVLRPGGEIRGAVVDNKQKPLAGATVRWFPAPAWSDSLTMPPSRFFGWVAQTDTNGNYLLRGLPEGRGTLHASKPGYNVDTRQAIARPDMVWNDRLTLFRGNSIRGTVRDGSGKPIAGVHVIVMERNARFTTPTSITITDRLGEYELFDAEIPGAMPIVLAPGYFGTAGGASPNQRRHDHVLAAAPTVTVRVKSPDGQPVRRFAARIVSAMGEPSSEFTLVETEDGQAAIPTQVSGNLHVEIRVPGYAPSWSKPTMFDFGRRPVPEIEVVLTRGRTLRGQMLDEAGAPLANMTLDLRYARLATTRHLTAQEQLWHSSTRVPMRTDDRGRFEIPNLRPMQYALVAESPGMSRSATILTVTDGDDVDLGPIRVVRSVRVSGTLTVGGKPRGGIRILLRHETTREQIFTWTDRTGGFRFDKPIAPGKYVAIALPPPDDKTFRTGMNLQSITVPAGKSTFAFPFNLD